MKNVRRFAVIGLLCLAGCAQQELGESAAAVTGPTLITDQSSYAQGQNIKVTWGGLPGNALDWVAIAPAGSPSDTVTEWVYTNGAASGNHSFAGPANGSYVARAFDNDSYTMIIESSTFTVGASGATVGTDFPSYTLGQPILANWSGLPGNPNDWVAIAPAGSPMTTVITYAYTGGAAAGSHGFGGITTAGNYVVRAFPNDTYALLAEAPFSVTGSAATVTTDQPAYSFSAQVTVTWSGLPGNATDWIAIAPQGSSNTTVSRWVYTGGATSGSHAFEAPSVGGAYVARAFVNDTYSLAGESAAFAVGVDVTTDKSAYATTDSVSVSWTNLPGNPNDWIAIAPAGSPTMTVTTWVYTGGAASGTHVFSAQASGTYVARAFLNNSYTLLAESASFTVGAVGSITVTSDLSSYAVGQDVMITWTNLPGNANDWIALAPAASSDTTVTRWVYTGGAASGSHTFVGGLSSPASYVGRAFLNDTYSKLGESTPFDVQ